jgi:hypothetical protein
MSDEKLMMNIPSYQLGDFKDEKAKEIVKKALRSQVIKISFEKTDGTIRDMSCTLMESKIPDEKKPKTTNSKQNSAVLPVFDVEKEAWRSFRWESIKKIAFQL